MENVESVLDELNDYDKKKTAEIPKLLEEYINHLAKTGDTLFPWSKVRGVIRHKLEIVIANFREICPTESLPPCPNVEPFHYETMRDKILVQFDSFNCAPFTIQRLCELLCAPRKHYKRTDKFMRGIEKNLLVVSTVDPEQRKRVDSSSSQTLVNGVVEGHAVSNIRAAPVHATFSQRPTSAASDVASVSDADSGISDTEDEDKPHLAKQQQQELAADVTKAAVFVEQSKEEASTNGQQVTESPIAMEIEAGGTEPVPETAAVSSEATLMTEEVKPSSPAAAPSEAEPIATLTQVTSAVQQPEEPATALLPLAQEETTVNPIAVEVVKSTPTAESETIQQQQSPATDKKRPLEREENDEDGGNVEHSPDAKQPRIFNPDKVMDVPATVSDKPVIHEEQSALQSQPAESVESSVLPIAVEATETDLVQPVAAVAAEVGDQ